MVSAVPPNVLLIVADDLPRNLLGSYGATHGLTPNIDALGARGTAFTHAYTTSPLCTPSRFSLLTGRYASRAADQGSAGRLAAEGDGQVRPVAFQTYLSRKHNRSTLAHAMRVSGHVTAYLGKYHVGHPLQPADCGIGERGHGKGAAAASSGHSAPSCATAGNQSCLARSLRTHAGFEHAADVYYDNDALTAYAHQPEWMAFEATRFLHTARSRRRPFFLMLASSLTHSPADVAAQLQSAPRAGPAGCGAAPNADAADAAGFVEGARKQRQRLVARLQQASLLCSDGPGKQLQLCADERLPAAGTMLKAEPWLPAEWFLGGSRVSRGWRSSLATSLCLAAWLDTSLEPLFESMRAHGEAERTLTLFTADHGPFFAGKGHAFEAGIRVPLLLSWPDRLGAKPRQVSSRVTHLDLLPTLSGLGSAGGASAGVPWPTDGASFSWLWAAGSSPPPSQDRPLFIEVGYSRAVVSEGWKLIVVPLPAANQSRHGECRSIHGLHVPLSADGTAARVRVKFLYDALERHTAHHCEAVQLYDLSADPAEQHNVAAAQPARVEELSRLIRRHVLDAEGTNPVLPSLPAGGAEGRRRRRLASAAPSGEHRAALPRSWCQTCHPSTACPPWPEEAPETRQAESSRAAAELELTPSVHQLIRQRVASLLDTMRHAISPQAVASLTRVPSVRAKCVLLRASGGRLLVDLLDSNFDHRNFSMASCFPSKHENFLRSRLHISLRLLLRALRRERSLPDFEVALCPDDCPPALGAKPGARPALTSVSCDAHRTLPFVSWIVNTDRATDLSEWDDNLRTQWEPSVPWAQREAKGIFRGHLRSYSYCGGWPEAAPIYREAIDSSNWRSLGRAAVWAARVGAPELINANFGNHKEMAAAWRLSESEAASRDEPNSISMHEQSRRFRYLIHAEGQCGSADRLKQSLASPMLLLKQGSPCREWFEPFLTPGEHFLQLDGNFSNLTTAVRWAQQHDEQAQAMVAAANRRIREVVSVRGLYAYSELLVHGYAKAFAAAHPGDKAGREPPRTNAKFSHEFSCAYGSHTACALREL